MSSSGLGAETPAMVNTFPCAGASFSPCGTYRYALWRAWAEGIRALWIMLNPSTADAESDDPTIRRCISYTRAWGWSGLVVVNLFALRSSDPDVLLGHVAPVGDLNDWIIDQLAMQTAGPVVCAWGVPHPELEDRAIQVASRIALKGHKLRCLGRSKDGWPRHPLYVKRDQPLEVWL